jgi:hypothetical protein
MVLPTIARRVYVTIYISFEAVCAEHVFRPSYELQMRAVQYAPICLLCLVSAYYFQCCHLYRNLITTMSNTHKYKRKLCHVLCTDLCYTETLSERSLWYSTHTNIEPPKFRITRSLKAT